VVEHPQTNIADDIRNHRLRQVMAADAHPGDEDHAQAEQDDDGGDPRLVSRFPYLNDHVVADQSIVNDKLETDGQSHIEEGLENQGYQDYCQKEGIVGKIRP
jgi:hypothetical protein